MHEKTKSFTSAAISSPLLAMMVFFFLLLLLQSPSFSRVRPEKGPVSGGTRLTVTGRHLDAGSSVTVYIDKEECLFVKSVWIQLLNMNNN